ncbi:cytosine permease [Nocardia puris]|uniref:Cytosine permease n=1 Tax=Nocardia puris TaxID=208602 RepID=A0A366DN23_9NOCA|nr:cytosine permease [Nocardia puris]MBF6211276.1 cytosine permease [Nocardia puris]MBF6364995.1 cytosine permease [Nocardia puris]MBF6458780.1 cytosine permease [Nocardia puris]RBO90628.1 cytosine permease [Nocardia puris]
MSTTTAAPASSGIHSEADEFETTPVPPERRRSLASVSAVWFGFPMVLTCAVFGGLIVYSLGFWTGMLAILVGNLCLMGYVGALSVIAGRTGKNFALTAAETFGRVGAFVPSAFLATIVIGWFAFQTGMAGAILNSTLGWPERTTTLLAGLAFVGLTLLGIRALSVIGVIAAPVYIVLGIVAIVLAAGDRSGAPTSYQGGAGAAAMSFGAAVTLVIAAFIDSGTMTADFTRWSRNGKEAFLAAVSAFPVSNSLALVIGGVVVALGGSADPGTDGGNFLGLLIDHGGVLVPLAVAFVFINLGSVCAHCLYNGAVGWSQLTGGRMRRLTLILGAVGVALAVAGIWSYFEYWLSLLGVIVPPIGAVVILGQLVLPRFGIRARAGLPAFIAWAAGAAAALLAHAYAPWLSDAVIGFVTAAAVLVLFTLTSRREKELAA